MSQTWTTWLELEIIKEVGLTTTSTRLQVTLVLLPVVTRSQTNKPEALLTTELKHRPYLMDSQFYLSWVPSQQSSQTTEPSLRPLLGREQSQQPYQNCRVGRLQKRLQVTLPGLRGQCEAPPGKGDKPVILINYRHSKGPAQPAVLSNRKVESIILT